MGGSVTIPELEELRDKFGNLLTRQTRNNADLASHYAYTPERHRFYRNGTREIIHYDLAADTAISGFEDKRDGEEDVFVLSPSGGETLSLRSAERFRYTVDFLSEFTQAWAINQELVGNDEFIGGLDTSPNGDLSDGYFFRHTSNHSDSELDFYAKRNGSIIGTPVTIAADSDRGTFKRTKATYAWYNVLGADFEETATTIPETNNHLANIGSKPGDANTGPGGRGPISGNGRIVFQITADASTTGLELYAGSMSFTTLGAVGASVKAKGAETPTTYTPSQTGSWVPVMAIRANPDRPNVNTQVRGLEFTEGSGKALIIACDPSNVKKSGGSALTDADFGTPEEWSGQNSAAEVTDVGVVTQFPDSTGSPVASTSDPGGYQLSIDTTRQVGTGSKQGTRSGDLEEKHGILDGDYGVLVVKPATTDVMRWFYTVEMDE